MDASADKNPAIIGKKYIFEFSMAKAIIEFLSEDSLCFTITEKLGVPQNETETVAIKLTAIRPGIYMVTWKEKNNNTITQVQDFQKMNVYSNWTLPDGTFINERGKIYMQDRS